MNENLEYAAKEISLYRPSPVFAKYLGQWKNGKRCPKANFKRARDRNTRRGI